MNSLKILAGLLLASALSATVWAQSTNLPLTDDSYVNANQPDANYGLDDKMVVHSYGPKHALVRFDSATIAGRDISAATLSFQLIGLAAPGTIDIYPITTGWNESTVTWSTRPTMESAPVASIAVSAANAGDRVSVDITSVVQRWADGSLPDAGVLLGTEAGIKALIAAKEGTPGLELTLVVETEASGTSLQARVIDLSDGYEIIDEPGFYVLDRSWFDVSVPDGIQARGIIEIDASNVTIDLRGYEISTTTEGAVNVIQIFGDDVSITNGSIRSDDTGCLSAGDRISKPVRTSLSDLEMDQHEGVLELGDYAVLSNVNVRYSYGIWLGDYATVVNSRLSGSHTVDAVRVGQRSIVRGNLILTNDSTLLQVDSNSLVTDNIFDGGDCGCTLIHIIGNGSIVRGNTTRHRPTGNPNVYGIYVDGSENIIDGNILTYMWTGINFGGAGNFYGNNRISAHSPFIGDVAGQVDWGGNVSFPLPPD